MSSKLPPPKLDSLELANILRTDPRDTIEHAVQLHDDTLRDGEQTVGVAFTIEDKVELARAIIDAGIRSISVGFPSVSEQEREAARAIVKLADTSLFWAFARATPRDIETTIECGLTQVGMFVPLSDCHLQHKLGISVDEAYRRMQDSIRLARSYNLKVRFGFEDPTRSPLDRVVRFVAGAVEAGATQIGIADTMGILTPLTTYGLITRLVDVVTMDIPIFTHFHNDLGMATANSITACVAGAQFVMGTLAGLGERAGNVAHEEVAVALRVKYGVDCGVDLGKLTAAARRAAQLARLPIAPNKAILGANAFRHESGLHVHGLLRERSSYEPFPPELIGSEHRICFGKHSGMSSVRYLADIAGIEPSDEVLSAVLETIKERGTLGRAPTFEQALDILRAAHTGTDNLARRNHS